jgi:hypothetical protein
MGLPASPDACRWAGFGDLSGFGMVLGWNTPAI